MSCITSLCTLSCGHPSRAVNSSHSSLPVGLQRRRCENCVVRTGLVRLVLVDDDAFPNSRGDLWVTSLAILACCRSASAATAVLNSWNSVSCSTKSRCSRPSSWRSASGPYFSDTVFASAFDSSILRNYGCPFHACISSTCLAHTLQRSVCLMLLFLQGLLHCPNLVLGFCSSSSSA